MKKVLLFGGSFDPIHNGHLKLALASLKETHADELWFVLATLSPFKEEATSFKDRAQMVQLMINPYKRLKLCTIEQTLPAPSYSIDTVKALMTLYPESQFSWLIGSDQIEDLPKWKDFEQLRESIQFVVYPRPGFDNSHDYPMIKGHQYAVSSTEIRMGTSFDTHPLVLNYMMTQGLYLKTMTKHRLSEKRTLHTLAVCDLAVELAEHYRLDVNRVRLAAMTHDWCKEWTVSDLNYAMAQYNPQYSHLPQAFYHGFAAASLLAKCYYVCDKQVLQAIRSHVNGMSTSMIGMILYIADKCERSRGYDSESLIHACKKDIRKGFKLVKQAQVDYLRSKNGNFTTD